MFRLAALVGSCGLLEQTEAIHNLTLPLIDWNPPIHFRHVLNLEQPLDERDAPIRNLSCRMNSMVAVSAWAFDTCGGGDECLSFYFSNLYDDDEADIPGLRDICSYLKSTYFALRALEDEEQERVEANARCHAGACDTIDARRQAIWNAPRPRVPSTEVYDVKHNGGREKLFSNNSASVLSHHLSQVHNGMKAEDVRRRLLFLIDHVVILFCLNTLRTQYQYSGLFRDLVNEFIDLPRRFIYEEIFGPRWNVVEELLRRGRAKRPLIVAELGVEKGSTMRYLLSRPHLDIAEYYAVDPLASDDKPGLNTTLQFYYRNLSASIPSHARIIRRKTQDAFSRFANHYFDLIFIDADHDFRPLLKDIEHWAPKVKPGGIIAGHDFSPLQITVVLAVCYAWHLPIHIASDSVWWVDLSDPVVG